jgi:hypothetical protein
MVLLGSGVYPDYLPGETALIWGGLLALMGPTRDTTRWVLLGHESLETRTINVSGGVSFQYIVATTGISIVTLQAASGVGSYIVAGDGDMSVPGIDDVSTKNITLNGAEVLQWRQ